MLFNFSILEIKKYLRRGNITSNRIILQIKFEGYGKATKGKNRLFSVSPILAMKTLRCQLSILIFIRGLH